MHIDEEFGNVNELEESSIAAAFDQDKHPVTVAPPADDDNEVIHVHVSICTYTSVLVHKFSKHLI